MSTDDTSNHRLDWLAKQNSAVCHNLRRRGYELI